MSARDPYADKRTAALQKLRENSLVRAMMASDFPAIFTPRSSHEKKSENKNALTPASSSGASKRKAVVHAEEESEEQSSEKRPRKLTLDLSAIETTESVLLERLATLEQEQKLHSKNASLSSTEYEKRKRALSDAKRKFDAAQASLTAYETTFRSNQTALDETNSKIQAIKLALSAFTATKSIDLTDV